MKHQATSAFWDAYDRLPTAVQKLADRNFQLLKADPSHPSLRLKPVGRLWSVRVGLRYRALATRHEDTLIWFWIGSHAAYDQLVGR
ncbi:type II toxin-antitoxin system RelE family toxin [Jiella mangrovi]|uniref:ParE-like toxin domain-containing protein n=1 Tax=Jiella mangrovi TaxID=2821407 RepID=A0ABS4BFX9_9HYPH|nr:hypothetical protein [Jiella mangrovi]MBP0614840.1 hypothetical protein [Jiella mangrovi]